MCGACHGGGEWVFISLSCCNTDHKFGGLKLQKFTVLEVESPRQRCQQEHATSRGSVRESFLTLEFQLRVAPGVP